MKCRVCDSDVANFLSFGKIPLGNACLSQEQLDKGNEEKFDLDIGFCSNCCLVQQTKPPPLTNLEKDYRNYSYVPVGESLRGNLKNLSKNIAAEFNLGKESLFVDIGSNDGTLLSSIKDHCRVLGIEPAVRISEISSQSGVPTINAFFSHDVAESIISEHGYADAITVTQVLQHIPELIQFLKDVKRLLKPNGVLVVEGRYFGDTIIKNSFDTVYHEMIYFFTLTSLINIFESIGMNVFKAEHVDVYGGSLRVYVKNGNKYGNEKAESVEIMKASEKKLMLHKHHTYVEFANKVYKLRSDIRQHILELKEKGMTIAGYGAPSTSSTLLNFCSIGKEEIMYIVDDSPLKQGLFTPGTHIPIKDASALLEKRPDYLMLLAWRLQGEILPKLNDLRDSGTKVILPLPEIRIV